MEAPGQRMMVFQLQSKHVQYKLEEQLVLKVIFLTNISNMVTLGLDTDLIFINSLPTHLLLIF